MWLKTYKLYTGFLQTLFFFLLVHTWGNVEDHCPELNKVLENVEENSPILLEKSYLVKERLGQQMTADSVKGPSLSINPVSYTHLPSPRDYAASRMPSSA